MGIEPEMLFARGVPLGVQARYMHGITDWGNAGIILGTGNGEKRFRVGANITFDIFPDIDGQPGIGIAAQLMYYRLKVGTGQFEPTALPYIHNAFDFGGNQIEPYFSVPVGLALTNGTYTTLTTLVLGAIFSNQGIFRYVMELGVAVQNVESYISGGISYYY